MARIVTAVLRCEACGRTFEVRGNNANVKCPLCGFAQPINLDHQRFGTAFLKVSQ